jgi:hypothetical protein
MLIKSAAAGLSAGEPVQHSSHYLVIHEARNT